MSLHSCSDTSEAVALEASLGLHLKPISKIKISVQLPKLKMPGQSISSWQVMEKLKAMVRPDQFRLLKALKISSAVIKFEGELETRAACERALARVSAAGGLKLSGFSEWLQIRATHATCAGPTRHDWDAFFRDVRGVDEMKPGERPDTVYLQDLPVRWFAETSRPQKPSERVLRKAFSSFGRIRRLEIPERNRADEQTFGKTNSLQTELLFEVYIQYEEYVEFATAMDSLRGKKLLFKDPDGKVYLADIKVDFDRSNYLSDKCIKKRNAENQKLILPVPDSKNEPDVKNLKKEILKVLNSAPEKCQDTEKNTKKPPDISTQDDETGMKLLLKELLLRAEASKKRQEQEKKEKLEKERLRQLEIAHQREEEELKRQEKKRQEKLIEQERILKEKLLKNLKAKKEQKVNEIREKLRKELAGRKILKSVLANVSSKGYKKGY